MAASALAFVLGACLAALAADTAAADSGEEIVARVRQQARALERQYVGSFTKRSATTRVSDPDSKELKSTVEVEVDVWEYNGEHPIRKVRVCRVDGKEVELEKCNEPPRIEPAHRIFAEDAAEHYRLEYVGRSKWDGQPAYEIRVVPLDETERHLEGSLYVRPESLMLAGMDVTLADYPFGLQSLSIEMNFVEQDGAPVLDHGRTDVLIYVPLVINDRSVTEFRASDQKLLTERVAAK